MLRVLAVLAVLGLGTSLVAAADPKAPTGHVPTFATVTAAERGNAVQIVETVVVMVPQVSEVEVKVGDRVEKRTQTSYVTVQQMVAHEIDGKKNYVQRANGKVIDLKDVVKEVGTARTLLVSHAGKIDPAYLKLLKDDTLVLILGAN